jgi:hypothetical protein
VAAWLVAGLVIAGCSSSGGTRDDASSAGGPKADELAGAGSSGGGATAAPAQNASAVPDAPGPRIVKKADLRLELARKELRGAVDRATSIADAHGGYVASTAVSRGGDGSTGTLVVRVPAAEFDAVRRELSRLGDVQDERLSGDDVSSQLVDYKARIVSLQAQEDALRTLLGRANAVGEVLQVQGQLFDVRRQIEQLQGQQAALADAADFSTITIRLAEPGAPARGPGETATGLARSAERAWDAAVAVVGGMLVALGVAVPLAVVALLGWLLSRMVRQQRHRQAGVAAE